MSRVGADSGFGPTDPLQLGFVDGGALECNVFFNISHTLPFFVDGREGLELLTVLRVQLSLLITFGAARCPPL